MANEFAGKNFLLEVDTGGSVFVLIAGLQTKSMSGAAEAIDVTNHGSNQKRELLDGSGILSYSGAFNGILKDAANQDTIRNAFVNQTLTNFRFRSTETGGKTFTGLWKVTAYEQSGDYNSSHNFSMSIESSGDIAIT